jgi:hypothetical protein
MSSSRSADYAARASAARAALLAEAALAEAREHPAVEADDGARAASFRADAELKRLRAMIASSQSHRAVHDSAESLGTRPGPLDAVPEAPLEETGGPSARLGEDLAPLPVHDPPVYTREEGWEGSAARAYLPPALPLHSDASVAARVALAASTAAAEALSSAREQNAENLADVLRAAAAERETLRRSHEREIVAVLRAAAERAAVERAAAVAAAEVAAVARYQSESSTAAERDRLSDSVRSARAEAFERDRLSQLAAADERMAARLRLAMTACDTAGERAREAVAEMRRAQRQLAEEREKGASTAAALERSHAVIAGLRLQLVELSRQIEEEGAGEKTGDSRAPVGGEDGNAVPPWLQSSAGRSSMVALRVRLHEADAALETSNHSAAETAASLRAELTEMRELLDDMRSEVAAASGRAAAAEEDAAEGRRHEGEAAPLPSPPRCRCSERGACAVARAGGRGGSGCYPSPTGRGRRREGGGGHRGAFRCPI